MKKIMLIGRTGAGKTTLTQALNNQNIEYKKTQAVSYTDKAIDTPGEYIENRSYYKALIVLSADSEVIGLLQDCTDNESIFPPTFGATFAKPVIGIITKVDQAKSEEEIKRAENYLISAGAQKIFKINPLSEEGTIELIEYLKK
ncbi:EutP/PduV family microcompartment system protein [Hathewaya massiliensis]|uniref:EutP/PduV family microcompartment system protein n=1 Tax=Hathewaya massiliensis TaxID=1964382 RepID=UPI00115A50DE|nr:EutP/PduV family microcompartment system protein [Hathewaya massiliensis]